MKVVQVRKKVLAVFILATLSVIYVFYDNLNRPDQSLQIFVHKPDPLLLINNIMKKVMTKEVEYSESITYLELISLNKVLKSNKEQNVSVKFENELKPFLDTSNNNKAYFNNEFESYLKRKTYLHESDENVIKSNVSLLYSCLAYINDFN